MIVPPTSENLSHAAQLLRDGKLIGMPTETVYGIAANALDENAVRATFVAKGRPAENPLIVHIANADQLETIAESIPGQASLLARSFWPGPLTMVLKKKASMPDVVTGGLDTVAVRMPSHPVALQLIREAGCPVSAPSANLFTALSPTSAEMIDPKIANALSMILDGGACDVGIESTVVDLTVEPPKILRPGGISKEQIESALDSCLDDHRSEERRSPGMYAKHYAPKAAVEIVEHLQPGQAGLILDSANGPNQIAMPRDATGYARELYQSLFDLDQMRIGRIYIQSPATTSEWDAVWDRLKKIAGDGDR